MDSLTSNNSTIKKFRTLFEQLNLVLIGLLTLSKRCFNLKDALTDQIATQLQSLYTLIDLDQKILWQIEASDEGITALIKQLTRCSWTADEFASFHNFIDEIKLLLSALSHKVKTASHHCSDIFSDTVLSQNVSAKVLNRRLLAYEVANGRTHLRSAPLRHILNTTNRCNLRCLTCFQSVKKNAIHFDIADETIRTLSSAIPLVQSVMIAAFGEPLLSPSVPSIIAKYKQAGAWVELITNGTLLSRVLDLISEIDELRISFDGGTRETYNAIRRGGNFDKLVAQIGNLTTEQRRKVCLTFVVTKQNIYTSEDLLKLALQLQVGQVQFQEMTEYLPWHNLMMIDDADRKWFFLNYPTWADKAKQAGCRIACNLVPTYDPTSQIPDNIEALTAQNIAAVGNLPITRRSKGMSLPDILSAFNEVLDSELPKVVTTFAVSVRKVMPRNEYLHSDTPRIELKKQLHNEIVLLNTLIKNDQAMIPHCLATYTHLFVTEYGTTRSCCTVQSHLASIHNDDFYEIRNSQPNIMVRSAHAKQNTLRMECVGCRDPLRFHSLVELLEELNFLVDISEIRKPEDFPIPASIADHPLVMKLGSRAKG
jgi:sulfatase maturation enzyme AslB (radical SAM superfamily)